MFSKQNIKEVLKIKKYIILLQFQPEVISFQPQWENTVREMLDQY